MTPEDLAPLRAQGLTDRDLHDATQVIAYFNYINRIADALGTDLEPEMPARPEVWGG
jgi:alkylhydroperoxidase family enzyme